MKYEDYRRGLCLLDPYGLSLDWDVVVAAARTKTIEIFLNFPVMDMNRNALWNNPSGISAEDIARMNAFWGDESWRNEMYTVQRTLFGQDDLIKSGDNSQIAAAYRRRLVEVGFTEVPEPIPMRNSRNATVYYLFFASRNRNGAKIAEHILRKYAGFRGGAA